MRPSHLLFSAAMTLVLIQPARADDFASCPAKISVDRQKLSTPVAGWSVIPSNPQPHALQGVTFYDGDPADKADLAPDSSKRGQQTWAFAAQAKPYWLTCHYSGTTVVIGRQLPKQTKSCTVTFVPNVSIDGAPVIDRIACK
jgi:hypothetical protein